MTLLQWKPAYSLAIASVDLEHREMIAMINDCYDRMGRGDDARKIEGFLGEIHAGISAHFALEEQLMRKTGYPEFQAHKADHEELLDQIRGFMDELAANPEAGMEALRKGLSDWFARHFSTFDAHLHDHFPH